MEQMIIPQMQELDRKRTQAAVDDALEKYRFFKTITFVARETSVTASYQDRPHGATNHITDKTASIAVYNVDEPEKRKIYCEGIEQIIDHLPQRERILMKELIKKDRVYNYVVYNQVFDPPISEYTFYKVKWEATKKLAYALNIQVFKDQ